MRSCLCASHIVCGSVTASGGLLSGVGNPARLADSLVWLAAVTPGRGKAGRRRDAFSMQTLVTDVMSCVRELIDLASDRCASERDAGSDGIERPLGVGLRQSASQTHRSKAVTGIQRPASGHSALRTSDPLPPFGSPSRQRLLSNSERTSVRTTSATTSRLLSTFR